MVAPPIRAARRIAYPKIATHIRSPPVDRTLTAELPSKIGARASVRGWVQAIRDQKRVQFVVVRDETGAVQVVLGKDDPPSELNEAVSALTPESAVTVTGSVVADERVKLGGLELQLEELQVDSLAEPELPIAPDSALDKRIDWRYLDLRRPDRRLIFEVQTHSRARHARVLARRALRRDPHAQADGLRQRVRRRAVQGRVLRHAPPTSRSRRSSTSRWRSPAASNAYSRSGPCSAPTRRSPRATTPSSRASTWRSPGSTLTRT